MAREHDLPAVVNVAQATQRIVSGQTLRVDGTRGEVVVLVDGLSIR